MYIQPRFQLYVESEAECKYFRDKLTVEKNYIQPRFQLYVESEAECKFIQVQALCIYVMYICMYVCMYECTFFQLSRYQHTAKATHWIYL